MNSSSVSARGTKRAFNFNPGPAALPLPVLEQIQEELLDYRGTGMSVMELSHRSPEFEAINENAERSLREVLDIPGDYAVAFVQGGGSQQFAVVPLNLYRPGHPVDVLHTGTWTTKAIEELRKVAQYRIAASTESEKFTRVPQLGEIDLSPDASYVHICTNNTIEGTQWSAIPATGEVPLVADMSSDIASRITDIRQFGVVFAGTQKNLGPAGVTIVIIRRDLAERASDNIAKIFQYRTHIKEHSLYHTPSTFGVYALGLVLEWIKSEGGIPEVQRRNEAKAKTLYQALDSSQYYRCPIQKESRSKMNVVFRIAGGNENVEKKFAAQAETEGLVGVKGHRSVGGMRISLYNAVTLQAVEALIDFMREFEQKNG